MRIDLIFPAYPPFPHAIGEYTALLADALRHQGVSARVIFVPQSVAMGFAGHASPEMNNFYTHTGIDSLHRAADALPDVR
jgi:hypothetical protein